MRRVRTLAPPVFVLAGAMLLADAAGAEQAGLAWNQEQVAQVAASFHSTVNDLYDKVRVEGHQQNLGAQSADVYVVVTDLKILRSHTRSLSGRLKKGEGRNETHALFYRIGLIVRQTVVDKRQAAVLANSQPEIDKAAQAYGELERYYQQPTAPVATPPPEGSEKSAKEQ